MIVTTGNMVEGHQVVEYLGIVRGIVVRAPTISQGIAGGLSKIFGGNIEAYAEACESAREEAYRRMLSHASHLNADAIIGMRYDATEFSESVTEVLAYGTAVKINPVL
jgi:uncharacterized protein YbjQ (UPF0145 family)